MTHDQERKRDEAVGALIEKKADDLAKKRDRKPPILRHLAHVGVLGWIFILPVVLLAWLGHEVSLVLNATWPAVFALLLGVAIGAYGVWRNVSESLR